MAQSSISEELFISLGESEKASEISQSIYWWHTEKYTACLLQVSGSRPHHKRVKALVDCRAVSSEQLAFFKDEIIVVTATNDPHWWVSATTAFQPLVSLVKYPVNFLTS